MRVAFVSVVPSPYQRDLFAALVARDGLDLQVFYLEDSAPDSPWPRQPLRSYEQILPGFWIGRSPVRFHLNRLPANLDRFDIFVLNTIVSMTAQRLVRGPLRRRRWVFWGERLRKQTTTLRTTLQNILTAPLARAHAIAASGSLAEADYRRRFPGQTIANIPYHTDLEAFAGPSQSQPDCFTFLFCGQMIARKGLDILIDAFARVSRQHPEARLLLVGRSEEEVALLANLEPAVREQVEVGGFQPPDRLPSWFQRADAFVLPSRHDGWGVVVNQALGAGLPLICTDAVGAAHDLLIPGENGLRVPAGDITALTQAMEHLLQNPAQARVWGAASKSLASKWTPEAGAAKWHRLLTESLKV